MSTIVEHQWLEHAGSMKICSRQGEFELMSINYSGKSGGIIDTVYIFNFSFNMKVFCVFPLKSPHRGDPNKYTQHYLSI